MARGFHHALLAKQRCESVFKLGAELEGLGEDLLFVERAFAEKIFADGKYCSSDRNLS